jgi:hypothetical protein
MWSVTGTRRTRPDWRQPRLLTPDAAPPNRRPGSAFGRGRAFAGRVGGYPADGSTTGGGAAGGLQTARYQGDWMAEPACTEQVATAPAGVSGGDHGQRKRG